MIFVNFKTYEQGTGNNALALVGVLEEVARESSAKIIPVVQSADIAEVVRATALEVWAQKIDPIDYGAHTGGILPEAVFEDGALGTFLNHSEAKFDDFEKLAYANKRAGEVGLKTLIFATDIKELERVIALNPSFVAYEPAELVGKTDISVAQAHPDVIGEAFSAAKEAGIPLIVGAGVHSREDVEKSLHLGAVGVAVATDVVKADSPRAEILDLLEGFNG